MNVVAEVTISAPKEDIWQVISNIGEADRIIKGIDKVEVLEQPGCGLVGFKWRETRTMMGKQATETMWVTAATENESYEVEANSHGMAYHSVIRITPYSEGNRLSWEFGGEAQTFMARIMGAVFGVLMKGSVAKMLRRDLEDIKRAVEAKT